MEDASTKRLIHLLAMGIVGLLALSLAGCGNVSTHHHLFRRKPPAKVDPSLTTADLRFGLKLFRSAFEKKPDENLLISPCSLAFALQMTYNGAAGETQKAMAKALDLQRVSIEQMNRGNAALEDHLSNLDPQVQLSIANSLWANRDVSFQRKFLKVNRQFYDNEVETLDFSSPEAPRTINAWVSKQTHGKIREVVETPIPSLISLYLIDAVYFKGKWTVTFKEAATQDAPFTLLNGTKKIVRMMYNSGQYRYLRGDGFQAISLSYGKERVSMYIFLPDKNRSLKEFCQSLSPERWNAWMAKFAKKLGDIRLPRFRVEYDAKLDEVLADMGMAVAFTPYAADFSQLVRDPLPIWIYEVRHKSYIEVSERFTEAAAVSSVPLKAGLPMPRTQPYFTMVVDHPFLCAIRDNQTQAILFMGAIVEPK